MHDQFFSLTQHHAEPVGKHLFEGIAWRSPESHKNQNGSVLIVGGSEELTGAPLLAGAAALRAGADKVVIAAPSAVAQAAGAFMPDLISIPLSGKTLQSSHLRTLKRLAPQFDIVLAGPGAGVWGRSVLQRLMRWRTEAMVIDADALHVAPLAKIDKCILTPHARELSELLAYNGIAEQELQGRLRENVLLRKGHEDLIITAHKAWRNTTGTPGMSVGGTGDLLAGVCAGLYAQVHEPLKAALAAAYVVGRAGERVATRLGHGLIASDLLETVAQVLAEVKVWERR